VSDFNLVFPDQHAFLSINILYTGKSQVQVALRWLLQKDFIPSVIIGANSVQQLEENMGAGTGWKLTDEQVGCRPMQLRLSPDLVRGIFCYRIFSFRLIFMTIYDLDLSLNANIIIIIIIHFLYLNHNCFGRYMYLRGFCRSMGLKIDCQASQGSLSLAWVTGTDQFVSKTKKL